jgi:hypothetical protein
MKKSKILLLALSVNLCSNSYSQSTNCGARQYGGGGWNPPISQVKAPSATIGGYALPNTNFANKANSKVVGDFNGDGLDDLFIMVTECSNITCSTGDTYAKLFLSTGNGNFTLSWTSASNILSCTNSKSIDLNGQLMFIAGNFTGDSKDEILIYKKISDGSQATFYYMLSNLQNSTPTYSFGKEYPNPQSSDPKIGNASLNGANFYSANLIGDSHDELFSIEYPTSGPAKWFIQTFDGTPAGVVSLFNGTFNFISEKLYFANFDLNTSYDELLTVNSAWAMLQNFNIGASTFNYRWSDMGNGGFFGTNQCDGNFNQSLSAGSKLLVGNLDNCDDDIECMLIPNNDIEHPVTVEFNSIENRFICNSILWPSMPGSNNINATQSSLSATANELYTTPRTCANYLWSNQSLCLQWTGGNQVITPRQFYSRNEKDGPLEILLGNFYNNTSLNGFVRPTSDLIIFRNNYAYDVPSNLNNTTFLTNCAPNGLFGGGCDGNTSIPFTNTLGQVVAYYNKPNDSFVGYGHKAGASYSLYSLTNGNQNLRVSNSKEDETINESIDIKEILINIMPNPATDIIKVDFYSNETLNGTQVSFMNAMGESIEILLFDVALGKNQLELNVSSLASGWYSLRFVSNNKVFSKKFIKN